MKEVFGGLFIRDAAGSLHGTCDGVVAFLLLLCFLGIMSLMFCNDFPDDGHDMRRRRHENRKLIQSRKHMLQKIKGELNKLPPEAEYDDLVRSVNKAIGREISKKEGESG